MTVRRLRKKPTNDTESPEVKEYWERVKGDEESLKRVRKRISDYLK